LVRWAAADIRLDTVESADTIERFLRDRRGRVRVDIEELAPHMRPTRGFGDRVAFEESVEAGIAVGMKHAFEGRAVTPRALALAVRGIEVRGCWRALAAPGPLVAHIDPEPPGPGLAEPRRQNRHRRIVAVQDGRCHHLLAQRFDKRLQQCCRAADPIGEGRALELDTVTRINLALAI